MYNTQDYWVLGLCPSSGVIKNTKEYNVSENWSASFFRWGGAGDTLLGPLEGAKLNYWTFHPPPHLTAETDSVSRRLVFLREQNDEVPKPSNSEADRKCSAVQDEASRRWEFRLYS